MAATLLKKLKLSIKDFLSKCDPIRSFLWILSHLLKKSENFFFYAVFYDEESCLHLSFNKDAGKN